MNIGFSIPREDMAEIVRNELAKSTIFFLMSVEALGSYGAAEKAGLVEALPYEAANNVRTMLPASRGGLARGLDAEVRWERTLDAILNLMGEDAIDHVRAMLNENLPPVTASVKK